jgi:hypothetical protein
LAPERVKRGISRAVKNTSKSGGIVKRASKCELTLNTGTYSARSQVQSEAQRPGYRKDLLPNPVASPCGCMGRESSSPSAQYPRNSASSGSSFRSHPLSRTWEFSVAGPTCRNP